MKYEEVCKSLLSDFPDIEKWEDDSELSEREKLRPYYLAVCFIFYLGRKFYQGELEIVRRGFSFIEKCLCLAIILQRNLPNLVT